ncbi:hypothetical protein B4135_2087 [Caldibacillus debilis]|uniref:Uncharacterized protein n=1 Tax=Caldibacillus debilis TaxID=301148 RepID=A0A150M4Q7_9BACI|nr:hypothetical protein B4135_2087 [Caldibacillus debilis]
MFHRRKDGDQPSPPARFMIQLQKPENKDRQIFERYPIIMRLQ